MAEKPNYTEEFELKLGKFIASAKAYRRHAVACALLALENFEAHGDLSLCQRFYDELRGDKKVHNPSAFAAWLLKFAPVLMDGKKFKKDKSENAHQFDLVGAAKTAYFEMGKDNDEVPDFTATDFLNRVKALLKSYANEEKHHPVDKPASAIVRMMEKKVEEIERVVKNNPHFDEAEAAADAEVKLIKKEDVKAA